MSKKHRDFSAGCRILIALVLFSVGAGASECSDELIAVDLDRGAVFFSPDSHRGLSLDEGRVVLIEDDPGLRLTALIGNPVVFEKSDSVMVMFPGMGGAVKKYGIASSAGQFARSMLSENIYPVGIQNWVYFGADERRPIAWEAREALAEKYSQLPVQMAGITSLLDSIVSAAARHGKLVSILTRSNGTGLILQWLSEAAKSDERAYRVARELEAVFVAGLNSPLPHHRPVWIAAEEAMEAAHPGSLDPLAKRTDRALYEQMTWANAADNAAKVTGRVLCPVVGLIAVQDPFVPEALQLEVMHAFHRGHAEIPLVLAYTDLEHDPLRGFDYHYQTDRGEVKRVRARSAARFKSVYRDMIVNRTIRYAPGELTEHRLEEYEFVKRRVEVEKKAPAPPTAIASGAQ